MSSLIGIKTMHKALRLTAQVKSIYLKDVVYHAKCVQTNKALGYDFSAFCSQRLLDAAKERYRNASAKFRAAR